MTLEIMVQLSGIEIYQNSWPIHAILMTSGAILIISGALIAHYWKKKSSWLKNHHAFEYMGFLGILLAFVIAIYMVGVSGGPQFRVLHAYSGIITISLLLITLILGPLNLKVKRHNSEIRKIHRWIGRITFILLVIQIISGLFTTIIL